MENQQICHLMTLGYQAFNLKVIRFEEFQFIKMILVFLIQTIFAGHWTFINRAEKPYNRLFGRFPADFMIYEKARRE